MSERSERMQQLLDEARAHTPPPASGSTTPAEGHTVDWRKLDDIQAHDTWVALRGFVEWVTIRYDIPISVIPTCWWQHPGMVEELSALHAAHQAAFDPNDTGYGPITWHEKFATTLTRISRSYGGGCSNGHHTLTPRSWTGVTDESAWDAWINQTHAH